MLWCLRERDDSHLTRRLEHPAEGLKASQAGFNFGLARAAERVSKHGPLRAMTSRRAAMICASSIAIQRGTSMAADALIVPGNSITAWMT